MILSVSLPSKTKYSTVNFPSGKAKLVSIVVNAPLQSAFLIVCDVDFTVSYKTPASSYIATIWSTPKSASIA